MTQGIVMVAHGARAAGWDAPFQAVLARLRNRDPQGQYALAFLEHMQPTVAESVRELAARGCVRITLVPLLLGVGAHAREDLPRLLAAAQAAHPQVQFRLSATLGESEALLAAMAQFVRDSAA